MVVEEDLKNIQYPCHLSEEQDPARRGRKEGGKEGGRRWGEDEETRDKGRGRDTEGRGKEGRKGRRERVCFEG